MTQFHSFQLQVTGLSWNSTGSVVAASYPRSTLQVYSIFGSSSGDVSLIRLTGTNQWFRIQHIIKVFRLSEDIHFSDNYLINNNIYMTQDPRSYCQLKQRY